LFLRYRVRRAGVLSSAADPPFLAIRRTFIWWEKRTSQGSTVPVTGAAER